MVWLLAALLGLALETWLIVVLGLQVTGPWERALDPEFTESGVVRRR
jgi:hypothetical protein